MPTLAQPRPISTLIATPCAALALAALALIGAHPEALVLKAAGAFNGGSISGVANFIDAIKGNLLWLTGTIVGLAVVVIGVMFLMGHSRAQDYAIKGLLGLLIIGAASGIAA